MGIMWDGSLAYDPEVARERRARKKAEKERQEAAEAAFDRLLLQIGETGATWTGAAYRAECAALGVPMHEGAEVLEAIAATPVGSCIGAAWPGCGDMRRIG